MGGQLAGFVDAGFLKAQGARAIGAPRRRVQVNARRMVIELQRLVRRDDGFLRAYWYDGALDPKEPAYRKQRAYFDAIASTPGLRLRLGHLQRSTPAWQRPVQRALEECGVELDRFQQFFEFRTETRQKGVDTLMVLDMVRLAERHAYDIAVLVAGDRDLAEAVRAVQDAGRLVVVLLPEGAGVAAELRQLADVVRYIEGQRLRGIIEAADEN